MEILTSTEQDIIGFALEEYCGSEGPYVDKETINIISKKVDSFETDENEQIIPLQDCKIALSNKNEIFLITKETKAGELMKRCPGRNWHIIGDPASLAILFNEHEKAATHCMENHDQ